MYKYIYGPIKSRRLGYSLGVNMVPHKTCPLDCIYCECGATTVFTTVRREYVSADAIIGELDAFFASVNDTPDYVTFGGSGEPTLNSGLGKIIRHLKDKHPSQKLALLTNSALLYDKRLRNDILPCDLILPSLDAVSDDIFQKVNAPIPSLNCKGIIEGLLSLSAEYAGQLWLEIFIAPGINDNANEIARFKEVITKINPTRVQLNSLDRPGTINSLTPAPRILLEEIAKHLSPLPTEIVARC